MNLSKNFTYREMIKSKTATKLGIKNAPNDREINNANYLCEQTLQPLRNWYNVSVLLNSWFRCKKLNDSVGSTDSSLHRIAAAVDIDEVGNIPLIEVVEFIYNNLPFTELIAEYLPNGWIHLGTIEGRENERTLKIKDKNYNYVKCKNLEDLRKKLNGRTI